ncbi:MAG: peptide chain release factor 2 [Anaerolineales bacterium]
MDDLIAALEASQARLQELLVRLEFPEKEKQLTKLERASEDPNLWDDAGRAQSTMRRLSKLRSVVESWRAMSQRTEDALELAQLGDETLRDEIAQELSVIQTELEEIEFASLLSGKYDADDAILAIHAGAGGTDSQDWAQMLERMYLRWAESRGFKTEILDRSEGEEAGIRSVTIAVGGDYAFGYLRSERGVHRLVRISPYDSARRRHTSFALAEVYPQVETDTDVEISPKDIRVDTFLSAGAGGQNVQKNETAVRITHEPTGIVVTSQNERSQTQNKENAMRVLRARLLDLERQKREERLAEIKGEHVSAEWGSQIRSYVLHPYQMVKDHRTNREHGNTSAVLDGDLTEFMEAYLKSES